MAPKTTRIVDTRTTNVDLSKYDEKLDNFVHEDDRDLRSGNNQKLKKQQLEEEKRQFDQEYALQKSKLSGSSPSGGGGGSKKSSGTASNTKSNNSSSKSFNQSVLDLGKGPVSSSHLADMAANGEIVINKDGTVSKTNKVSNSALDKYTKYNFNNVSGGKYSQETLRKLF